MSKQADRQDKLYDGQTAELALASDELPTNFSFSPAELDVIERLLGEELAALLSS